LWRALMALSASSEVAYLTKQQPVNEMKNHKYLLFCAHLSLI
jgi:hypothetical protein